MSNLGDEIQEEILDLLRGNSSLNQSKRVKVGLIKSKVQSAINKAYADGVLDGQRQLANTIEMVQESMFKTQ